MFAAMDNLQQPPAPPSNSAPGTHPSIDPRKQELLEARFMGSTQRMAAAAAAAGFTAQTQPTQQQHYHPLHHSLGPQIQNQLLHPSHALPPHQQLHHPLPSLQPMIQQHVQSSSSTGSNPSSSSPSIPPNSSPFSSVLNQQPQHSQPSMPQGQQVTVVASLGTIINNISVPPPSFTMANNNSLNNLPNANNNSAGSTQSSNHYSAHSSSHNQDSNLSTTSAGSHCSDKQEPPIHCDNIHAHNLPPTPEKRSMSQVDLGVPTTPSGVNGNNTISSQRKRRKKDPNDPPPERTSSIGSKRGESKKVNEYFKVCVCIGLFIMSR